MECVGTKLEQNSESTFMQAAREVADIGDGTVGRFETLNSSSSLEIKENKTHIKFYFLQTTKYKITMKYT